MNLKKVEEAEQLLGVGRFQVSSILQKRVQEIVRGAPSLIETKLDSPIDVALEEILEGRITLELYDGSDELEAALEEGSLDIGDDAIGDDDLAGFEL